MHPYLGYCLVGSVNRQTDSRSYSPPIAIAGPSDGGNVVALVGTRDSILAAVSVP